MFCDRGLRERPTRRGGGARAVALGTLLTVAIAPASALALGGPFTWEGVVCWADAFADVEVTLGDRKTRKKDSQRLLKVVGNSAARSIRKADWGQLHGDFHIRADLGRSQRGTRDVDAVARAMLGQIVREGRYRIRLPLRFDAEDRIWRPMITVGATLSRMNYHEHPEFQVWWRKVEPIWRQKEAAAKSGKPFSLCTERTIDGDPIALGERAKKAEAEPSLALPP